jgi:hypothetical protein
VERSRFIRFVPFLKFKEGKVAMTDSNIADIDLSVGRADDPVARLQPDVPI